MRCNLDHQERPTEEPPPGWTYVPCCPEGHVGVQLNIPCWMPLDTSNGDRDHAASFASWSTEHPCDLDAEAEGYVWCPTCSDEVGSGQGWPWHRLVPYGLAVALWNHNEGADALLQAAAAGLRLAERSRSEDPADHFAESFGPDFAAVLDALRDLDAPPAEPSTKPKPRALQVREGLRLALAFVGMHTGNGVPSEVSGTYDALLADPDSALQVIREALNRA